jgi:hypothetical protein
MPDFYEIRVKGHFDQPWSDWFGGLELTQLVGEETLFSGLIADQAALHGLLKRIRDLNLTLLSVICKSAPPPDQLKGDFHEND